ncbi:hypothetical protein EVAR_41006_1 [Eumeta japonica]|uniref:Uncharacterized protein n=1 Tax=Eumeta variegata TaxID=151549 RepID=A0A4C1XEZ2_EUMVA|nr:hypothetical protein EVAR_41006_1 [Eumeta japonica]
MKDGAHCRPRGALCPRAGLRHLFLRCAWAGVAEVKQPLALTPSHPRAQCGLGAADANDSGRQCGDNVLQR